MSKHPFKAGDMVRIVADDHPNFGLALHSVHPVHRVDEDLDVYLVGTDSEGGPWLYYNHEVEPVESAPVEEPAVEPHTGTEERLMIEALPKGGFKITKPGTSWGTQAADVAGFSTLAEATAFIGREMRA